jgi:hypothetical protein
MRGSVASHCTIWEIQAECLVPNFGQCSVRATESRATHMSYMCLTKQDPGVSPRALSAVWQSKCCCSCRLGRV